MMLGFSSFSFRSRTSRPVRCAGDVRPGVAIDDDRVTRIRGDKSHVLSKGYIYPKGASLASLREDPDRLTAPLVKA
jgi:anaerobic selenocysteine-containing dehydrogenase